MKGDEQRGRGCTTEVGGAVAEKPACLQQGGDKNLRGAGRQRPSESRS